MSPLADFVGLLSFSWSEHGGVSLSVENAQARIGRPLTPVSVAGVARRQTRRAAYGYGAGVVGATLATSGSSGGFCIGLFPNDLADFEAHERIVSRT
jgi:hypothetical protein